MTDRSRIARLAELAALVSDAELARLAAAQAAVAQTGERLSVLKPALVGSDSALSAVALAGVHLRYERWAEARRQEINRQLARDMAQMIKARESARQAFGRAAVLRAMAERDRRG